MTKRLQVKHGATRLTDPEQAVADLAAQIGAEGLCGMIFFCSPKYDLAVLGRAISKRFQCPVAGCTSAGQIGLGGFQPDGITAASFASAELSMRPLLIQPLSQCESAATAVAAKVDALRLHESSARRAFGLLLVDGLAMAEERLTATLYRALGDIPLIGGSAGDDLAFERTHVYFEGHFLSDVAVFVLFETSLPFTTFKFQHFVPTEKKLVVTAADQDRRVVHEIDGEIAADAYARFVGVPVSSLDSGVFSRNPLMLKLDGEYYVRAIQRVNDDGGLVLYCAIEAGIVLTLGKEVDAMATVERAFASMAERVTSPEVVIGCDCVLRRLELEEKQVASRVWEFFAKQRVIGFSTYGEQFNAMHVNQTFTGVALGN